MKRSLIHCGIALLILAGNRRLHAEEAHAAVYVVDRSAEFVATEGACLPFSPAEKPGTSREVLGIAKGPPGSTILMIAFDRDAPFLGLAPVIAEQTEDSKPVRFPGEGAKWPYETSSVAVDLYVAVFDKADPDLAKIVEYAEWLTDALKAKDEVEVLLHAEVIKKRLSNLLRRRNVEDYRVKYGDELTSLREPPTSKAATTRGNTNPLLDPGKSGPEASIAPVRRGLKTLDSEWQQDGRAIPFALANPGVLVFPITTAPVP